jgi:hypothetical protein
MSETLGKYIREHVDEIIRPKAKVAICAYSDLLGFGSCLDNLGWDILKTEFHHKTIRRLQYFIEKARKIGGRKSTCFALNDCLSINYDLPEKEPVHLPEIWWFLLSLVRTHLYLNKIDKMMDFPGVRTVWAAGQRLIDPAWIEGLSTEPRGQDISHPKGVYWIARGPSAIAECKKEQKRIATYTPREFQLNLAFSKAYALDEGGTDIGLEGPYLFVDESLIMILCNSVEGQPRTSKDCWGYFIVDLLEGTKRTISLYKENSQGKDELYYQLKLKRIRKKLKMRWGYTSTYRLVEAKSLTYSGDIKTVSL